MFRIKFVKIYIQMKFFCFEEMKSSSIDLSETKVIDQHCHMFLDEARNIDWSLLVRVMSLEAYNPDFVVPEKIVNEFLAIESGKPSPLISENEYYREVFDRSVDAGLTSLFFLESLRAMGKFLGCEPDLKTVLKKRNERSVDSEKICYRVFTKMQKSKH